MKANYKTACMDCILAKKQIISFIQTQVGNKPAVLGLSGGLDSAVVAFLAVEALGAEKVHALILPSFTNTEDEIKRAEQVAQSLNLQLTTYNLQTIIESYQKNTNLFKYKQSLGNLKARIRMAILYGQANELNGIVLGTGNKTEIMTGYSTKYGDAGVDILPIGDLYKTEVRALAKHLGVPQEIIDVPPTAGLWEGQTDEGELGITYERLDAILVAIEQGKDLNKFDEKDVNLVKRLVSNSKHKRELPPICKIKD
jgi:NAD+ synthase